MKAQYLSELTSRMRFATTLFLLFGVASTVFGQQKVCPGQSLWHGSSPNVNTVYWIEFFVTNGVIVQDSYNGTNINNPTYASFTDVCGNDWSCGYPTIKVRWDNNGEQGNVKERFHYSVVTWPFYFSYDIDVTVNIGTPAPTHVYIDGASGNDISCSRTSFVAYAPDLSAWNAQYSWNNVSNTQFVSSSGTNAVFQMNSGTSSGSFNLHVTNSQCPSISHNFVKSFNRVPANPSIFGPSMVYPGATENYQVDGSGYTSYNWSVPSDWQVVTVWQPGMVSVKAGNMANMDGDIVFTYTDACGYSGQTSKYVNTGNPGGRIAAKGRIEELVNIQVSPNPVENMLTVKIPGTGLAKVTLSDTQGKEYTNKDVETGEWMYNMHFLPAGLYIVKVKTNDKLFTKKVVKLN